jgi:CubicO group peptidase (beta-lactamase class C family)
VFSSQAWRSLLRPLRLLATLVVTVALVPGVAVAAPPGATDVDGIAAHVAEGLEANRVPGGALAVVAADGTVHVRGFGVTARGGDAVTPDTPFIIGSVTKSMTALAVLQLVEGGQLALDDPVALHLDWFHVQPAAWTQRVTIRRLLEQTSGLPALAGAPATTWMRDASIEETARQVAGTQLVHEPGTSWEYANANYVLLGAVIEEVTGRAYADQLEQRVFAPLGMTRTTARLDEARALGLGTGHRYVLGVPVAHTTFRDGLVPSGLVVSTAHDLGRYLQTLLHGGELDGGRVLSQAGVAMLFTPASDATLGPWAKDPAASYGMGWFVGGTPFGPTPVVFHPGATPDFGATVALVPSASTGLVVLVNVGPRVAVPGGEGDVDRIGAGAVSLLIGSEPAVEGTVIDAYRRTIPVLALVLLVAVVLAARRPSTRRRPRHHALVAVATAVAGLAVLALPTLALGWRQNWLWAPDLTAAAALVGAALMVASARRVLALRTARRGAGRTSPPTTASPRVPLATGPTQRL